MLYLIFNFLQFHHFHFRDVELIECKLKGDKAKNEAARGFNNSNEMKSSEEAGGATLSDSRTGGLVRRPTLKRQIIG